MADALHSSIVRLLRRLRATDVEMGLSPARASALSVLVFGGDRSPSELAVIEGVSRPTMTKLLQGMRRDGLVRIEADPSDRRALRIHATPRGRKTLERGRERRIETLAHLLEARTPPEYRTLASAATLLTSIASPE